MAIGMSQPALSARTEVADEGVASISSAKASRARGNALLGRCELTFGDDGRQPVDDLLVQECHEHDEDAVREARAVSPSVPTGFELIVGRLGVSHGKTAALTHMINTVAMYHLIIDLSNQNSLLLSDPQSTRLLRSISSSSKISSCVNLCGFSTPEAV